MRRPAPPPDPPDGARRPTSTRQRADSFIGRHAIVIGGSLAGLLAARVLADAFERVTIVERDDLVSDGEGGRPGVPQGRHVHVLLNRGASGLSAIMPEMREQIAGVVAFPADMAAELAWFHYGVWKAQFESGLAGYFCNRPILELAVRRAVSRLPNVTWLTGHVATGLLHDEHRSAVTGVRLSHAAAESRGTLNGDVVVDASGRTSKAPDWLASLGYGRPRETNIVVRVGYSSRLYTKPSNFAPPWKVLAIFPKPPLTKRLGIVYPVDRDHLIVTLGGWCGDYPPADEDGFLQFAASLPVPTLHQIISETPAAGPIHRFRFPSNRRRHYEKLTAWPGGLLVMGDALCSFNPIYGQGMTVCVLEAVALEHALQELRAAGRSFGCDQAVCRRLQCRFGRLVAVPWMLATTEDFRYPETTGRRPAGTGALHWYFARVLELSSGSRFLHGRFLAVQNCVAGPGVLFTPAVIGRVVWSWLKGALLRRVPRVPRRATAHP